MDKGLVIALMIIAIIIGLIILYFVLKPYIIKNDTTILFTGGLGSGKTLESVKRAIVLIRKNRLIFYHWGNWKIRRINQIRRWKNHTRIKKYHKLAERNPEKAESYRLKKPILDYKKEIKKPLIYSNIPLHFKTHLIGFKKEWSTKLTVQHICLLKEINEYSVVLIDEFPQFISQFEWDVELVQKNCNEFITFFRHYIGGYLIVNAQSEDEIECHFRRKLNMAIWCFDFHAWPCKLLPLFYTNRMCDYMLSENVQTMSTTYIEENTKIHFGLFPRKAYDSRCYSIRYNRVRYKLKNTKKWERLKTNEILKLKPYISPLDTKTTDKQIDTMEQNIKKLERNADNES